MAKWWFLGLLVCLGTGCGRYFPGPINPAPEAQQEAQYVVRDDGSINYIANRLEIALRPMSDAELNRQFAGASEDGANSTNPYTFGNWRPVGDTYTPPKYTVFMIQVKNYEFPKVRLDPLHAELLSPQAHRQYAPVTLREMIEYYYSLDQAYTGIDTDIFEARKDRLIRTLYPDEFVFSGQETEGYLVFPALDPDVLEFEVYLRDVGIRFDYRSQPVETADLVFRFQREVEKGYYPSDQMAQQ
ncbi:MAG: hypothetical protein GKR89_24670 [Candidatus Latescibacteria bacterium]|nr:hypothetical protein [Candidatus Latescibacterota bacterium]